MWTLQEPFVVPAWLATTKRWLKVTLRTSCDSRTFCFFAYASNKWCHLRNISEKSNNSSVEKAAEH